MTSTPHRPAKEQEVRLHEIANATRQGIEPMQVAIDGAREPYNRV
jgi:hypothetical protein